jgi:hypothetical protein
MPKLERFDVYLIDDDTKNKWSMTFQAEDYAHAEEQAINALHETSNINDDIVMITKDH